MEDECKNQLLRMRFLPAMIRFLLMNTTPLDEDRLENGRLLFTTTSLGDATLQKLTFIFMFMTFPFQCTNIPFNPPF